MLIVHVHVLRDEREQREKCKVDVRVSGGGVMC